MSGGSWQLLVGAAGSLLALWLGLLYVLWRARPDSTSLREMLRLVPEVLRLLARLARDRALPRTVRLRLWALLAYLASPVELVPDVIPVLGYADDVVLVVLTLRSVVRRAGRAAVTRHWPGSPEGLLTVERVMGRTSRRDAR